MLAMRNKFGWLLTAGALLLSRSPGLAFSLDVWPPAEWQDATIGYDASDGVGNLNEEYRWNVPEIFYAFDSSFLNYFGSRGVEEVEKAFAILNALPKASDLNLDHYPLDTRRLNARAQALSLYDLKSHVLGILMFQIGLTSSPRYVFTLRERVDLPGSCCDAWFLIRRNFDPYSWAPTSYINGQLWTYRDILCSCTPQIAYPLNEPVDPLAYGEPVAAMTSLAGAYVSRFSVGQFYTGLTRDDVGGLKYIYRGPNRNFENAVPGATGGFGPWDPAVTNAANTNFVATGLRNGVEKLKFTRTDFDSLLGQAFLPITNGYEETVVLNGNAIKQYVDRVVYLPDIIFVAADVSTATATAFTTTVGNAVSNTWTVSFTGRAGALRAFPSFTWMQNPGRDPNTVVSATGPGTYSPIHIITLNNAGPITYNVNGFFITETNAIPVYNWASFGTSTNIFVYPDGASMQDMERLVLESGTGGTAWGVPGYVPPDQSAVPGDTGTGGGG